MCHVHFFADGVVDIPLLTVQVIPVARETHHAAVFIVHVVGFAVVPLCVGQGLVCGGRHPVTLLGHVIDVQPHANLCCAANYSLGTFLLFFFFSSFPF